MSNEVQAGPARPKILTLFISYAREDAKIALAISNALDAALGETLADVFYDKDSLTSGFDFKKQIEEALERTDILIVVYTGTEKPSHSYTGWEVGFFRNVQRNQPPHEAIRKRIVALYIDRPPAPVAEIQGIGLDVTKELLSGADEAYKTRLAVDEQNQLVSFLDDMVGLVEEIRHYHGFPKSRAPVDTKKIAREMLLDIFGYLKTTIDSVHKPQKQILIRTNVGALSSADGNLPADAQLTPVGMATMALFGLQEEPMAWGEFVRKISSHKFGGSWEQAINGVVASSLQSQIVDNSQVIVSADEQHVFRLILTTSTTYFNGDRELSLYLVEALKRQDYGDANTTLHLRGLESACRFRFMFLEPESVFYATNIRSRQLSQLPSVAREIIRELNLLAKDAREAGLDQPHIWARFSSPDDVLVMAKAWSPIEVKLREVSMRLSRQNAESPELDEMRTALADVLAEVDQTIQPLNQKLIAQLGKKLTDLIGSSISEA